MIILDLAMGAKVLVCRGFLVDVKTTMQLDAEVQVECLHSLEPWSLQQLCFRRPRSDQGGPRRSNLLALLLHLQLLVVLLHARLELQRSAQAKCCCRSSL